MSSPLNTCRDVNAARGHICGLGLGHPGSHIQDLGNTVVAWGDGYTVVDETHVWPATEPTTTP